MSETDERRPLVCAKRFWFAIISIAPLVIVALWGIENGTGARWWDQVVAQLAAAGVELDPAQFFPPPVPDEGNFCTTLLLREINRRNCLSSVKMTVLVPGGERSPPMFAQILAAAEKALPSARRETLPKAGHQLNRTNQAAYDRALSPFLLQ